VAAPAPSPLAAAPTPIASTPSERVTPAPPVARAIDVAKPAAASVPLEPIAAPAAPKPPVATYVVAPSFPNYYSSQTGRVEATFSIAEDGSVKDIEFVGAKGGAFERAAERALRQWRFDPSTLPEHPMRYTQAFVFAPKGHGAAHEECVQSTGSLICRDPAEGRAAQVSNINAWPPKTGG
ncbi:TonB family protein, partial [Dokdonella sp.]|uniref:energy transducer TonB n=1 Tax=Dokdonella sp. TaxID=2291710 RepID=UPI002F41D474